MVIYQVQDSPSRDPLTGPPYHWSPISMVPFSLVPQLIGPPIHYWSSLVPHLIGPPYHWSPISLVPLFIRHPIIGQSQWSPNSSVPHLIGPPISTHASPIPLIPHLIGPPDSLVPQLISLVSSQITGTSVVVSAETYDVTRCVVAGARIWDVTWCDCPRDRPSWPAAVKPDRRTSLPSPRVYPVRVPQRSLRRFLGEWAMCVAFWANCDSSKSDSVPPCIIR